MAKDSRSTLVSLAVNPISLLGVVLTTTGGVLWLILTALEIFDTVNNPYLGILLFGLLPMIFFAGLVLIPLGIWWRRRQMAAAGRTVAPLAINWQNPAWRKLVIVFTVATVANLIIGSSFLLAGVHYMESNNFCGAACHVMYPENEQYKISAHSNVDCVACHVDEGLGGFVQAKTNGTVQLIHTVFNTYPKPVPTPVHNLPPVENMCLKCHSMNQNYGSQLIVRKGFAEDDGAPTATVLNMHVGGGGNTKGAHGAHLNGITIEYASDEKREKIAWVRMRRADGAVREYATADWNAGKRAGFETRTMNCVDCHNRAAHSFESPERALNQAMVLGRIDHTLPGIRKRGIELLKATYPSHEVARQQISTNLAEFYVKNHPAVAKERAKQMDQAAAALYDIYSRNVWPQYNLTWGSRVNHLGHNDSPGCFRCHGADLTSADGLQITQDCSTCHEAVAMDEKNAEILKTLGIAQQK
jgi:nitrate/TMAO reductase-like tetraheme cytochrome c subunit